MPEVTADEALITELISRGVSEIYPSAEALAEVLHSGKRLTVYMGIDPTAADMHVGHESQLLKLRRLQDLGHRVVLLIGDFTATIGDPTDKSAARVKLTREQVLDNARSYKQQAAKILDFDQQQNPVELRFNSEWLAKMGFADVLELASEFTVQQMLERDMFKKRMADNKPVGLHEFLYPIMQGWDSVCMDVDIEVGGSDQIFNMLVGSTLVKRHKGHQKFVIAGDLLVDPSGKKIGKTEGNMITLTDTPLDMFHKIMMWGDGITPHALELCSTLPMDEVNKIADELKTGKMSGLDGKLFLAKTIVTDLHGSDAAATAQAAYHSLTDKDKDLDKASFIKATVQTGQSIVDVLVESGLATSRTNARQLLAGNGVRVNEQTVDEQWTANADSQGAVLQVGKKKHQNHRLLKLA